MKTPDIPRIIRESNNAWHHFYLILRRIELVMATGKTSVEDAFYRPNQAPETRLSDKMKERLVQWLRAEGFTVTQDGDKRNISWARLHDKKRACTV